MTPYLNLPFPKGGANLTPLAAHLYVPPIIWRGDPVGHTGTYDCIFFLISGECYVKIDNDSFVLKPGQLAFLPKGKMRTYTTVSENFAMYEIAFDLKIGDENWCDAMGYGDELFFVDAEDPERLSRLFEESVRHEHNRSMMYDIISLSNFAEIIRSYVIARYDAETKAQPFCEVIKYMENSLDRQIKVEELAKIACMQTTYFIKKFKSAFGMSPISYLNKLKIYRSMTLLLSTDLSVDRVGQEIGIFDSSYFSKTFKKFCLVSPAEYRRLFRKN